MDVAIIGGGPAGLSAGMYLARAGWNTVLLEKGAVGGQARRIAWIENYPGFPDGISGKELMRRFQLQGRRWRLKTERARAEKIARTGGGFRVDTDAGSIAARAVISCAGANFRTLGLPGEGKFMGAGIYHCAFERAPRFAGKRVAVVGGGDTAAHQALLLSRFADRVFLIHRGDRLRAIRLLQDRLAASPNVRLLTDTVVSRAIGPGGRAGLERVKTLHLKTGEAADLEVAALFVLIGKAPERVAAGWRNPPPGFFSAGDIRPESFHQVSAAAADGIRAGMECEKFLVNG